jgi:formamidopyrimidine-DNA glycosylase
VPELPEVETVARQLAPLLVGRTVKRLEILDTKLLNVSRPGRVRALSIADVRRLGKWITISLKGGKDLWIAVHLRMTGRLIFADGRAEKGATKNDSQQEDKHLRARLLLDQGELLFTDVRRFGEVRLLNDLAAITPKAIDPMSADFQPKRLAELLGKSKQELKAWLLRQDRLVGLGNIYASEILYRARLSPFRPAGELTTKEVGQLVKATRQILVKAVENCGTTFSDFQTAHGSIGSYQRFLKVYGREGQPCRRCSASVKRHNQQGRSTFYCEDCQNVD